MRDKGGGGGGQGVISDKSRAFIMETEKGRLDAHTFSDRTKQEPDLWECQCKHCGRRLFITQTGDALGSATKNECL